MKTKILSVIMFLLCAISYAQDDDEGSNDPALFTRMPGYYISRGDDIQFDKFEFPVAPGKVEPVEGHSIFIIYWIKDDAQPASPIQIVRNYTNAAKKIGGQLVYEFEDGGSQNVTLKIVKDKKETWAFINASTNGYNVNIIEREAMVQDVVADAASMASSLKETGKVALYGIYFDSGQSVIKPESQQALQEIAKLIKADPSLKLYVVGHTDNTGTFDANMKLSMDRAAAVVNALVTQHGINAASLKACGNGPTSPVASNDTAEGKALNRRVELVKQ
jgi:outer membrane protein OmpA-like peptidoglycan-associated protein